MKIGVLSTWGAACGIATYSEELYSAVAGKDVGVIALAPGEMGSALTKRVDFPIEFCWARTSHGISDGVKLAANRHEIDLIHIQHEFGLFRQPAAFRQLLLDLRSAGIKTVVTIHTVLPYGGEGSGFYEQVLKMTDAVVVHTRQARAALAGIPRTARLVQIPHGSPYPQPTGNRGEGQEMLRIPRRFLDATWALAFGFVGPNKGLDETVLAFGKIKAQGLAKNLGLVICGETPNPMYGETLTGYINATGYEYLIAYRPMFVEPDKLPHIMAAADFGILNETGGVLSASGQVHLYAAHGLPLAVADCPKHTDAIAAGAVPFQREYYSERNPSLSCLNAISALARDKELRRDVGAGLERMAKRTAWPNVAAKYVQLYKELLNAS